MRLHRIMMLDRRAINLLHLGGTAVHRAFEVATLRAPGPNRRVRYETAVKQPFHVGIGLLRRVLHIDRSGRILCLLECLGNDYSDVLTTMDDLTAQQWDGGA